MTLKRLRDKRVFGALIVTSLAAALTSCSGPSLSEEHPGIDAESICSDAKYFNSVVDSFNGYWMPEAVNSDRDLALSHSVEWGNTKSFEGMMSLPSFDYPLDASEDSLAKLSVKARDTAASAKAELRSWLLIIDDTMALDHFLKFQSDRAELQDLAVKFALACRL